MKAFCTLLFLLGCVATAIAAAGDDLLDRVGDALTFSAAHGDVRARVSGLLDLEGYYTSDTRSDLRFSSHDLLLNPRLTTFLDTQLGARAYIFAQARVDRGLDPADESARVRLDELALRIAVLADGRLNLQAGKFATVFGAWSPRHHSWENPFVTAPLIFENLTGMWDRSVTGSAALLLKRAHVEPASDSAGVASDKQKRLPVIWGPAYASGVAMAGRLEHLEYAVELKNAALSSRPENWDPNDRPWGGPTFSGRLGYRPNESWNLGVSASRGTYLSRTAIPTADPTTKARDYHQSVFGGDVGFAHHHVQFWAEAYVSRFAIPAIGDVSTFGYYVEAKYKFAPQLSGAVRWNQQSFSHVTTADNRRVAWGRDTWRIDFALIHRLSAHTQLKLQYSPQHEQPAPKEFTHAVAVQFTTRF